MGGDGGSIPGRADVVRTKGYGFKRNLGGMGYDPNTLVRTGDGRLTEKELRKTKWVTCGVSHQALAPPLMCDKLGTLYNKKAALEAFLARAEGSDSTPSGSRLPAYIESLSELKQVEPTKVSKAALGNFPQWNKADGHLQCPITGVSLLGSARAYLFWSCGCIVSRKAWEAINKEPKPNGEPKPSGEPKPNGEPKANGEPPAEDPGAAGLLSCPVCGTDVGSRKNIYTVNPDAQEAELMRPQLKQKQRVRPEEPASKKQKRDEA